MPTHREEIAAKIAPLLAPFEGPNPAGADPTNDDDFGRLKAEIDKMSSVENLEPHWKEMREIGATLLTTKGKDLRVVGWAGLARVKLEGWAGLAGTLVTYDALARTFWDTMYPDAKRARGRVNAFLWLADQTAKSVQDLAVTLADGDAVRTCEEVLKDLDQHLAEKLGDAYPGPGTLRSLLREKVRAIPAAPPPEEPKPVAPPPSAAPVAAEASPAPTVAAPNAADIDRSVSEYGSALVEAAGIMRSSDATRALSYRLLRWGAWLTIEQPPPAEQNATRIRAPPEGVMRRIAGLRDAQNWLGLLNACEEEAAAYVFWLDLHRFAALALDRLGPNFLAAREVLGREVIAFVTRLPSVPGLTFADGTAFAESATKSWLEEEAKKYGGGGGSGGPSAASAEDEEVAARFAEAQKMATEGKVAEALAAGFGLAARGADARTRFRAGLAVGKMALDGSKPDVARALLERLTESAEHHDLEAWEPALCATLYSYLLTAIRDTMSTQGSPPDLAVRERSVFDKLCRLDPAAALKFARG